MSNSVRVLRAEAGDDFPEIGVKRGDKVYLSRDGNTARFFVVKYHYHLMRWVCSCGKGPCPHKYAVNEFLTEEVQKERMTSDPQELAAHLRDEGMIR